MFIHNLDGLPCFTGDSLVTRDYIDTRFAEFETRILSTMELRFKDMDARFGKLYIIGGIIIASTVIPALRNLYIRLGQV